MAPKNKKPVVDRSDPLWYKDAVVYEVHVRAFFDSNDDGIGDFRGLVQLMVDADWTLAREEKAVALHRASVA